jgi:hypothetical protein
MMMLIAVQGMSAAAGTQASPLMTSYQAFIPQVLAVVARRQSIDKE